MSKLVPNNIAADTDIYKLCHWLFRKPGTDYMYSYGESRGGMFDKILWFGLQAMILEHLAGVVVTKEKVQEAYVEALQAFGTNAYFNTDLWARIIDVHGGKLPVRIRALPEGSAVNVSQPPFTIEATDPECIEIVQPLETLMMHVWYTCTIATNSRMIKDGIMSYLEETGTPELIDYMCHDFGYRGVTCQEQAGLGGMSHLINFVGSDTTVANRYAKAYYGDLPEGRLRSVAATEHSIATQHGLTLEEEIQYVLFCLSKVPDDAVLSLVMDSKNSFRFARKVMSDTRVMEAVKARTGRTVLRPDSGNPVEVVLRVLDILASVYGYTYNDKTYKVLNHNVGLLQGDGMERETIFALYEALKINKWSADNLIVGSGGGLLQKGWNRDTSKWAIKLSYAEENGQPVVVQKDPATQAMKKSKGGMFKMTPTFNLEKPYSLHTFESREAYEKDSYVDALEVVFENGEMKRHQTFPEIIELANKQVFKNESIAA